MARAVRQPVVLMKWYRVVSWMLDRVDHFPKNQRFVFGQRLSERSIHVLELLVEAAWSQDKTAILAQANREMEGAAVARAAGPRPEDSHGQAIRGGGRGHLRVRPDGGRLAERLRASGGLVTAAAQHVQA